MGDQFRVSMAYSRRFSIIASIRRLRDLACCAMGPAMSGRMRSLRCAGLRTTKIAKWLASWLLHGVHCTEDYERFIMYMAKIREDFPGAFGTYRSAFGSPWEPYRRAP